jgi:hypothetical protein
MPMLKAVRASATSVALLANAQPPRVLMSGTVAGQRPWFCRHSPLMFGIPARGNDASERPESSHNPGAPQTGNHRPRSGSSHIPLITSLTANSRSLSLLSSGWGANG